MPRTLRPTIGSMPYWQAKVSACCTSCSSYALKAASRRSCCVLCSGAAAAGYPQAPGDTPLRSLFDKHRVWQNRRQLLSDALTRLSGEQLRRAVTLLTRAELTFKQDYGHDVWPELESLSLLLCHKATAVFIDG